jgi:hypothetical protein
MLYKLALAGFSGTIMSGQMPLKLQLDGEARSVVLADLPAASLFGGMPGRTSADLDIWRPGSDCDRQELKLAAEKAGLLLDPKQTLDPDRPYLQLVEPGLTQVGKFEPVFIDRIGRLHLFRPPVENLIAAKLIRAEPKDLGAIQFLMGHYQPDLQGVRRVIAEFTARAREFATENLACLDILKN